MQADKKHYAHKYIQPQCEYDPKHVESGICVINCFLLAHFPVRGG